MEQIMKTIQSLVVSAAVAIGMAAPAAAATSDPEVIIYRVPGVFDSCSGSSVGTATVFHCTNFSGVAETIRFVTRDADGTLKTNVTTSIPHLATRTAATHDVASYAIFTNLATGVVAQGTTTIAATSTNIICTAMTIDAAATKPDDVALRAIRFSPVPGSQE
jgi:hypothetical protein